MEIYNVVFNNVYIWLRKKYYKYGEINIKYLFLVIIF